MGKHSIILSLALATALLVIISATAPSDKLIEAKGEKLCGEGPCGGSSHYSVVGELVPHEKGKGLHLKGGALQVDKYDGVIASMESSLKKSRDILSELEVQVMTEKTKEKMTAKELQEKIHRIRLHNRGLREQIRDAKLKAGPRGNPGKRGKKGKRGFPGYPGRPGRPGPTGPQGRAGHRGHRGPSGVAGGAGAPGAPGHQGPVGPRGVRGHRGFPGPRGVRGRRGVPGRGGAEGAQGPQGLLGPRGPMGYAGALGPRGAQGQPGVMGPAGPKGKLGARGVAGRDGARGPRGPTGKAGGVGGVGFAGPAGPPGLKGLTGVKGPPGHRGPPGLRGRPGAPGPRGIPGRTGQPGSTGSNGRNGKNGKAGHDGKNGANGGPGPRGKQGATGRTGKQGRRGEKGAPGRNGEPGFPGPRGQSGAPGRPGRPGPTGPEGFRGPPGPVHTKYITRRSSGRRIVRRLKKQIREKERAVNKLEAHRYADVYVHKSRKSHRAVKHPKLAQSTDKVAVTGTVVNFVNGRFIHKAEVEILDKDGKSVTNERTNANGEWGAMLKPGKYQILVSKKGFVAPKRHFHVSKDARTDSVRSGLSPRLRHGQARFVLTWSGHHQDLDAKLSLPDHKCEVTYYNRVCSSHGVALLDFDSVRGDGPETITIAKPKKGTYEYEVKEYSKKGSLAKSHGRVVIFHGKKAIVFEASKAAKGDKSHGKIEGNTWKVFKWEVNKEGKGEVKRYD